MRANERKSATERMNERKRKTFQQQYQMANINNKNTHINFFEQCTVSVMPKNSCRTIYLILLRSFALLACFFVFVDVSRSGWRYSSYHASFAS